jgi:hypothetical protein
MTTVVPTSTCLRSARWPTGARTVSDEEFLLMPIMIVLDDEESKDAASSTGMLGSAREG